MLLKVVGHKQSLLLLIRISAVVPFKAGILAPVVGKVIASVVVGAVLKVNELHGAGVHLALLQGLQLWGALNSTCTACAVNSRLVSLRVHAWFAQASPD